MSKEQEFEARIRRMEKSIRVLTQTIGLLTEASTAAVARMDKTLVEIYDED